MSMFSDNDKSWISGSGVSVFRSVSCSDSVSGYDDENSRQEYVVVCTCVKT